MCLFFHQLTGNGFEDKGVEPLAEAIRVSCICHGRTCVGSNSILVYFSILAPIEIMQVTTNIQRLLTLVAVLVLQLKITL